MRYRIRLREGVRSYSWGGLNMVPRTFYEIKEEDLPFLEEHVKVVKAIPDSERTEEPKELAEESIVIPISETVKVVTKPGVRSFTIQINGAQVIMRPGILYEVPAAGSEAEQVAQYCNVMGQEFKPVKKDELEIYCPDGIGDLHWVFLKLGGLMAACGAKKAHLHIRDLEPIRPKRADEFVKMNPLVSDLTYTKKVMQVPIYGYVQGVEPYDYILDPTPILAHGRRIEEWLPGVPVDYSYKMDFPEPKNLDCSVVYYGDHLAEANWANGWGDEDWATVTRVLRKKAPVVLVGLECDRSKVKSILRNRDLDIIDMVGKTSFSEAYKLAMGARVMVGSISGLTIVPASRGARVVALWPGRESRLRLPEEMWTSWLKETDNYRPLGYSTDVTGVLRAALSIWRGR